MFFAPKLNPNGKKSKGDVLGVHVFRNSEDSIFRPIFTPFYTLGQNRIDVESDPPKRTETVCENFRKTFPLLMSVFFLVKNHWLGASRTWLRSNVIKLSSEGAPVLSLIWYSLASRVRWHYSLIGRWNENDQQWFILIEKSLFSMFSKRLSFGAVNPIFLHYQVSIL